MVEFRRSCKYGIISGLLLYSLDICRTTVSHVPFMDEWRGTILLGEIILGVALAIFTISYKTLSLKQMVVRTIVMFGTYFAILVFVGGSGIIPKIYKKIGIVCTSARDNLSGLGTILFMMSILGGCLGGILIRGVIKVSKKIINSRKN